MMKAKLLPLDGKYYGTRVLIEYKGLEYLIELWNDGSFEPSDRELEDISIEDWRNNVVVGEDSFFGIIRAKDDVEICDSHFESRETHELAQLIVEKLND